MSIVKSEFALALNQVATERGISAEDVIASIESAILAAYRKEVGKDPEEVDESIKVKLDKETGEARIYQSGKDITPPGFGRIAAQTAKQVTLQKIHEVEKKTVISHYQSQMGMIIRGRVIRYDGYNAYVDIGRVEAILPKEEQIKNEKYSVNESLVLYLKEIREDKFGNSKIIVSRIAPQLIIELFKKEVPEVSNGTVEIKRVAREPGERAKIAVFSSQSGVDPVGACVGQKGVRVQTVTNELGGEEKIDIIQWNSDNKLFLISALSPAEIVDVEIIEDKKKARVTVEETQAPLAIGKNGINVNLASKLTGYEIDIVQIPSTKPKEEKKEKVVETKKEKKEVESKEKDQEQVPVQQAETTEAVEQQTKEPPQEAKKSQEETTPAESPAKAETPPETPKEAEESTQTPTEPSSPEQAKQPQDAVQTEESTPETQAQPEPNNS